ncbi:isoprenoid biosynthesis glyoxalase ElbB [Pseudoalteromonas denitrificans]|uniref:Glyoxalase n=1 Tax=Pseudoalteromonas denitrificans DSM 6059 TaxID=1123010 RepID=A0A1I1KAE4_9GAMM|nr:isoprenoid biosynthesis glyoxalase ElbB [Pseudoalteromonas denitrificans]SFC54500.1 Enhancing lycopene biosynthesis protein 2 [Pseudoalteromonas denitrificans DSM 6059]
MKKIAVILSGCGVFDGSEIHEAVLTLLHIEKLGAQYQCFAPNIDQMHVINHLTGEVDKQVSRNVLIESARIARGEIKDVKELNAQEFDALILPGGFGAAKNLCDFATQGANSIMNKHVENACKQFSELRKPAAYICIAPAIIGHVYPKGVLMTIGTDIDTAEQINQLGAKHVNCDVSDFIYDETFNVISTPAYMLANSIIEANTSIENTISKVFEIMSNDRG